jgi:hypothetical protein
MPDTWYEAVDADAPLMQGEFVLGCPTLSLPDDLIAFESGRISVQRKLQNAVIMTQSCDLSSKGIETILLCPYYDYKNWIQKTSAYREQAALPKTDQNVRTINNQVARELKALGDGKYVSQHLLDKDTNFNFSDYQVVELNAAFSVKRSIVEQLVRRHSRIRLSSPYREHLSQAYATVFMRVGLPKNIGTITDTALYEPSEEFRIAVKAEAEAKRAAAANSQA